jgi:hypothetical protein
MSGPKTVALRPNNAQALDLSQQRPSTPTAACCETIRELAYLKWEAAGWPSGDGVEFWLAAEAELLGDACSDETAGK